MKKQDKKKNEAMTVEVHLYTQAKPCHFENVRNAYQKGSLYCVWTYDGPIYKFPLQHIFRIKEVGNPQHNWKA